MNTGWGRFVDVMKMLRKFVFALVGLAAMVPSFGAAGDQYVVITDLGFFPQVSYIQPGDTVYFENSTEVSHELAGGQEDDGAWTLSVPANTTASLTVTEGLGLTYNSANAPLEAAELSFDAPPEAAQAD